MNANPTLPLGLDGTVSVVFSNNEKVIIGAKNIVAGNPSGFARKVCGRIKNCVCEIKYIPNTLAADYHFTVRDPEWVTSFSPNPMGYLHGVRMILDDCLQKTDRFSI